MGLEVHSEPRLGAEAGLGNGNLGLGNKGSLEPRCRECSVTTSTEQHAGGDDNLCFTCGLFALSERGDGCFEEQLGSSEPLKPLGIGDTVASDKLFVGEDGVRGSGVGNAKANGVKTGGASTEGRLIDTPKEAPSEKAVPETAKLGLTPDAKLGVEKPVEGGIGVKEGGLSAVGGVDSIQRVPRQSSSAEIPDANRGGAKSPKAQPFSPPAALCVHCKGKPVFNKKESLCKSCAHAKWRYGWNEFPLGWKPGDRLKGIEKRTREEKKREKPESAGKRPTSPGKKTSLSRLEQERERVLTQGWRTVAKRERTTVRSLKAGGKNPSWTRFGQEHFPWDKPALGGGKGVLAALLAAEGSGQILNRKLADSLSRKDLNPNPPPQKEASGDPPLLGIDILRAAANQEGGGRTANFSKGLPRLETVNTEEAEVLEQMRIMSPAALQQTAYPNEPASLVKVAVAAQVLLEIATSPRDPPAADSKPHNESESSEQWKKPPPSRFVSPLGPTNDAPASSHCAENDDLRSRMGENQPSKWGDHELDDLPLRSPETDVHDEMQMGGEAVTLEDLAVLEGGKRRAVTLPIHTGNFPPRIETDGWTPRLDAELLTLGTATDGWTPNQDLDGFTPQGEVNGLTPRAEAADVNTPRNKTPSFHDIAANVFKAGRAAITGRRGFQRPVSADVMKAKSPLGEDCVPGGSLRRSIMPSAAPDECTPPEEDDDDSNEMSPSANRRKRKLKARQAQEHTVSGEDGKPDSGASEQDAPIVSPGIHKRGRTRAVLGRNVSGNGEDGSRVQTAQLGESEPGVAEPPKKRKGSWGGARKRGEKVVLPDSEEDEAILPRIESASEASRAKRPRQAAPSKSEEARKSSGGCGLLDLVKGRWDDAQRLRERAAAKRAEAERLKRVAETKQRLAQRLIERATELGNWPPGRKAKADERARRQQAAKKRNASETETEDDPEAVRSEEGSEEDEEFSLDGDPSGMSPDLEDWGDEEGGASERWQEGDSERLRSLDPPTILPDEERCATSDGRGWRCPHPRLPGAQTCGRHAANSQPKSHTKSETSSRRPEESATADSCPPFLDPLEPFKPKKHFGFRERTSFRPEHLQHLSVRSPSAIPEPKPEGEATRDDQPSTSREGFLHPEELLQLAKARQLKRARSARRHGPEVPGSGGSGAETAGDAAGEVPGGSETNPVEGLGEQRNRGGASDSEERVKRTELTTGEGMAELLRGDPSSVVQNGQQPIGPVGQIGVGNPPPATSLPVPGGFVQMVQSAAQTEPARLPTGDFCFTRLDHVGANPAVFVNPLNAASLHSNPVPVPGNPVLGAVNNGPDDWTAPGANGAPWEVPNPLQQAGADAVNGVASINPPPQPPVYTPPNGLASTERADPSGASQSALPSNGVEHGAIFSSEPKATNGISGAQSGSNGTYEELGLLSLPVPADEPAFTDAGTPYGLLQGLLNNPLASAPIVHAKVDQPAKDGNGVKESKPNGTNGVHRKRENYSGMGVTRSRAIEDGLPVGRTYTLPVELKLPVELRQPVEQQPYIQRGKRQTMKKKKRIPPPIDGIDDSMRCTKTGGSGWRCNQRRLEGYAKCERHMEIVAKRSRVEATKPVEEVPKEGPEVGPEREVPIVEAVK